MRADCGGGEAYLMMELDNSSILNFLMYVSSSSRFSATWSLTLGSHPKSLIMRMTFMAMTHESVSE